MVPETHFVGPVQLEPPHWPYCGITVAVGVVDVVVTWVVVVVLVVKVVTVVVKLLLLTQ